MEIYSATMDYPIIKHKEITSFADDKVNLHRDDVKEHREQVGRLRDRLAEHIAENPGFSLVKMLGSGSLAKGTALSTLNDIDVAVYMTQDDAPSDEGDMLAWLAERLREAYGKLLRPEQIQIGTHCVIISFRGSGLDVDVVPVYYEGDEDDLGYLIAQDTGNRVLTSIPLHLAFIRKRKDAQPRHFAQLVRLLKWWVRHQKSQNPDFRFKSFMVELICAHLADEGLDMSDYPLALERFFAFLVTSGLSERISFDDYYSASDLPAATDCPIEIFDPVNPENNVASRYTEADRLCVVEAAHDALDALHEAHYAEKGRAISCWKDVLGPSFTV